MENKKPPVKRNMDSVYIFAKRNGESVPCCFTDCTTEEQQEFLDDLSVEGLKEMCFILANALRGIGDHFGVVRRYANEESQNQTVEE